MTRLFHRFAMNCLNLEARRRAAAHRLLDRARNDPTVSVRAIEDALRTLGDLA